MLLSATNSVFLRDLSAADDHSALGEALMGSAPELWRDGGC